MKVELWVNDVLTVGTILKEDVDRVHALLNKTKTYSPPNRESDFKYAGLEYYTNEGLAFKMETTYKTKILNITPYEAFYNKAKDAVGLREITKTHKKRHANYSNDERLVKLYKNAVAENILLLDMEEPKNFGKVPKMR